MTGRKRGEPRPTEPRQIWSWGRLSIHNIALQSPTDHIEVRAGRVSVGRLSMVTGFSNVRGDDPKEVDRTECRWMRMDGSAGEWEGPSKEPPG